MTCILDLMPKHFIAKYIVINSQLYMDYARNTQDKLATWIFSFKCGTPFIFLSYLLPYRVISKFQPVGKKTILTHFTEKNFNIARVTPQTLGEYVLVRSRRCVFLSWISDRFFLHRGIFWPLAVKVFVFHFMMLFLRKKI